MPIPAINSDLARLLRKLRDDGVPHEGPEEIVGDNDEAFEVRIPRATAAEVVEIHTFNAAGAIVDYVAAEELVCELDAEGRIVQR